ncbi:WD40 repeat-like protein [Gymnopus androsaceus JB14]|uniref:WD40 repeat-like protein n=1 Tax=Gymnopus androsaceus JB14 TaxID=1447944 RepID=A0A6A4H3J8_9AGAR|nr:WD40 repeat-like protein [Gymnopus androsaceus JB14]
MTVSNQGQYKVDARVRTVLRGHTGGVLDLRVDDNWIVSCSKDTTIRVWNRKTLMPHRTLRGHEGPVNAVGMEDGRVVSASGDGKMILWDASSGERLRTFEGHDRGLACIEYSNGLIISGSNDWKIKIWSAYTGKSLVRALAFDPASGLLVSSSYDKSVRVWDIKDVLNRNGGENTTRTPEMESKSLLRVFRNAHTSHIFDVKFDVGRIVSTSHDQKIVVADFSSGLENGHLFL